MKCVIAALYPEAEPLIHALNLKPAGKNLWKNDKTVLALSGTGPIASASCTARVLALMPVSWLISYGSAVSSRPSGTLVQLAVLKNADSGRTFYPDLLVNTGLKETAGITGSKVLKEADEIPGEVYDMESAAVYEAGAMVLRPDQMLFFRYISDHGNTITAAELKQGSEAHAPWLASLIESLPDAPSSDQTEESEQTLASDLCCSVTMVRQLHQLIRYAYLAGIDLDEKIRSLYREGTLPVKDREKGKQVLKDLERYGTQ